MNSDNLDLMNMVWCLCLISTAFSHFISYTNGDVELAHELPVLSNFWLWFFFKCFVMIDFLPEISKTRSFSNPHSFNKLPDSVNLLFYFILFYWFNKNHNLKVILFCWDSMVRNYPVAPFIQVPAFTMIYFLSSPMT